MNEKPTKTEMGLAWAVAIITILLVIAFIIGLVLVVIEEKGGTMLDSQDGDSIGTFLEKGLTGLAAFGILLALLGCAIVSLAVIFGAIA